MHSNSGQPMPKLIKPQKEKPQNFYSTGFLQQHIKDITAFYDPNVIDSTGGYFHNYLDDGSLYDTEYRQLVSSTRIIVNYARAYTITGKEMYKSYALHGLQYLERVHWQAKSRQYAWTLRKHRPLDMTQQAYGYAFVLLAYAALHASGISDSQVQMGTIYDLLEERFWQHHHGLYADEIDVNGVLSEYRGQNANMHLCEAMIAAYQACSDNKYLERAKIIAANITCRQAALTDGLVWEHYTSEFEPDWNYNKDDPKNLYRPWGFQPGHQTEWAKLLLFIHRASPDKTLVERAKTLFDRAFEAAWDSQYGGLIYGFGPDGKWCDDDKYFWVQAESFAAAAMLYQESGQEKYLKAYEQLWDYSWAHFVDHQYGAWYRLLNRENKKYSNEKSSAGAKCDYHTLGACFDALRGMT